MDVRGEGRPEGGEKLMLPTHAHGSAKFKVIYLSFSRWELRLLGL